MLAVDREEQAKRSDAEWEAHGDRLWEWNDDTKEHQARFVMRGGTWRIAEPSWRYLQNRDDARDVYADEAARGEASVSAFKLAFKDDNFDMGQNQGFIAWGERQVSRAVDLSFEPGQDADLDAEATRLLRANVAAQDLPSAEVLAQARGGNEEALATVADWSRNLGHTEDEWRRIWRAWGLAERPRAGSVNPSAATLRKRAQREREAQ